MGFMPKSDTREQVAVRVAGAFVHAATGEWDALARSEDEPQTQREHWRTKATAVAKAIIMALLPLLMLWGVQQSPLKIPEAVAGYATIGALIWLVFTLLTSLDTSFHARVAAMQNVAQSMPFLGKWEGLMELDKHAANTILARAGLQLRSKANASSRTVAVTLEPGKIEPHSLFWLTKTTPAGVVDEDDAEAEAAI
jgi:hypothetical protein